MTTAGDFVDGLLRSLPAIRPGPAWHDGESASMICLDLLLNQRVGVERSSAAACALHDHFRRPLAGTDVTVADGTGWPYEGIELRPPAKSVRKLVTKLVDAAGGSDELLLGDLPSSAVGALASLERYYNRTNRTVERVWAAEITSLELRSLNPGEVPGITGIKLPAGNLPQQLSSTADVLEMRQQRGWQAKPLDRALRELPRVGQESAASLMVYLFDQPAVIVDEYLQRIAYRHYLIESARSGKGAVRNLFASHIRTAERAQRFHARIDDIGVVFCGKEQPRCADCPLASHPHRI